LLPTPCCHDAVTVRYPTALRRRGTDFHRSVFPPSQAHERRFPTGSAVHFSWAAGFYSARSGLIKRQADRRSALRSRPRRFRNAKFIPLWQDRARNARVACPRGCQIETREIESSHDATTKALETDAFPGAARIVDWVGEFRMQREKGNRNFATGSSSIDPRFGDNSASDERRFCPGR